MHSSWKSKRRQNYDTFSKMQYQVKTNLPPGFTPVARKPASLCCFLEAQLSHCVVKLRSGWWRREEDANARTDEERKRFMRTQIFLCPWKHQRPQSTEKRKRGKEDSTRAPELKQPFIHSWQVKANSLILRGLGLGRLSPGGWRPWWHHPKGRRGSDWPWSDWDSETVQVQPHAALRLKDQTFYQWHRTHQQPVSYLLPQYWGDIRSHSSTNSLPDKQ